MKIKNASLKRRIIEISYKLKLGHIGSCLTAVDIIDEIYKIKKPDEKFVLSAGHSHLAHLVVMEQLIERKQNEYGEILQRKLYADEMIQKYGIHCNRESGCDASTGSLGHGVAIACGIALSDSTKNCYVLISDGECAEGVLWETLQIKQKYHIDNLKIYCNSNGFGAYDPIDRTELFSKLMFFDKDIRIIDTSESGLVGWLDSQLAHYKVLNKEEYEELMEVLKD